MFSSALALTGLVIIAPDAKVFEFTPTKDAAIWFVFDGKSDSNLLEWAITEIANQLPSLAKLYEEAGHTLSAGTTTFFPPPNPEKYFCAHSLDQWDLTALTSSADQDFYQYMKQKAIADVRGPHESETPGEHRVYSQIAAHTFSYYPDHQARDKIIIMVSDIAEEFVESGEGCPKGMSKEQFIGEINIGMLYNNVFYAAIAEGATTANEKAAHVDKLFRAEPPVPRSTVVAASKDKEFDLIEWQLARVLSKL